MRLFCLKRCWETGIVTDVLDIFMNKTMDQNVTDTNFFGSFGGWWCCGKLTLSVLLRILLMGFYYACIFKKHFSNPTIIREQSWIFCPRYYLEYIGIYSLRKSEQNYVQLLSMRDQSDKNIKTVDNIIRLNFLSFFFLRIHILF